MKHSLRAAIRLLLVSLLLSACGSRPYGFADPVEAVLTPAGLASGGAAVEAVAALPPGTLVVYSYQQHGMCGLGYGLAVHRQGLWSTTGSGSSESYCTAQESRGGAPITLQGMATPPRVPQPWGLAVGAIRDPAVAAVEVEWDDGTVTSATVSGTVYYAHHPDAAETVAAHAYDDAGQLLGTVTRPVMPRPQP